MPRPKRDVKYSADAATIQRYFDESMAAKDAQKVTSAEISSLNVIMEAEGVHSGLLSHYCKIARMKPEKAALWLALDDFYRQALASRLPNPAEAAAKDAPVPFLEGRRTAAA